MPPRSSLRTTAKSLPEHARGHNRSLVLQTLYSSGAMSRADLARATGLTRVTISDLISELIAEDLVVEQGTRDEARGIHRSKLWQGSHRNERLRCGQIHSGRFRLPFQSS